MNSAFDKPEKSISILGCGWLGLPLAKFFINKKYKVKGSSPSQEKLEGLKKDGIIPYHIFLNPNFNETYDQNFFKSEILIINFPPKRREDIEVFHPKQFEYLIKEINKSAVRKVIFISSTSVYADRNCIVTEIDQEVPEKSSGKALRTVEKMLIEQTNFQTTIIRFGGLIGYDRKPGRFFSKTKKVANGNSPVNLIHQDDCIDVISHIIENELWGKIYNACCPEHPLRKDFYTAAAKIGGFPIPEFDNMENSFKIISSEKLVQETQYNFRFSNPIDALLY